MSTGASTQGGGSTAAYKVISFVAWGVGCYTSYEFLKALAGEQEWVLWVTLLLQAVLTFLESPIWRGKGGFVQFAALGIDIFTNVGGLFTLLLNLDATDSYQALVTAANISGEINPMVALLLSILFGALLAAAPEALWRQK